MTDGQRQHEWFKLHWLGKNLAVAAALTRAFELGYQQCCGRRLRFDNFFGGQFYTDPPPEEDEILPDWLWLPGCGREAPRGPK